MVTARFTHMGHNLEATAEVIVHHLSLEEGKEFEIQDLEITFHGTDVDNGWKGMPNVREVAEVALVNEYLNYGE